MVEMRIKIEYICINSWGISPKRYTSLHLVQYDMITSTQGRAKRQKKLKGLYTNINGLLTNHLAPPSVSFLPAPKASVNQEKW